MVTVVATNLPIFEEWIGTLDGYVNAQIRAQITGYLLTQNYAEGSEVKKGDLLFEIDPRLFKAALAQAQAKLAQDQAVVERTRLDVERYRPLARDQAISQQELDNAVQSNLSAQAQVKLDQAAIENATLNLEFTRITSPIEGLAGFAQVQIGDLVSPSGPVLTTVSTINPIKVEFQVSERAYLKYWRTLIERSKNPGQPELQLELILSDGSMYPERGKFFFADRQVNPTTGTLQIVGVFPNPNLVLRPGQYARVRAETHVKENALLVPQRAVTELQGSYQVNVVGEENKIRVQPVKVGEQLNPYWVIESGLKPGDRVVVEGLQKAKAGAVVNPKPFVPQEQSTNAPGP